jgi:hypothetical protein
MILFTLFAIKKFGLLVFIDIKQLYLFYSESKTISFWFVLKSQVNRFDIDMNIIEQTLEKPRNATILFLFLLFYFGSLIFNNFGNVIFDIRFLRFHEHIIDIVLRILFFIFFYGKQCINFVYVYCHDPLIAGPVNLQLYFFNIAVP